MAAWEQGLDELVRTRASALVGYAYLLCGDRREAEDLVQDALVKTFSRGRLGLEARNLEGYVRRAILTTYVDGFRRRRRWVAVRHLVGSDDVGASADAGVAARVDVAAALATLTPRERACVVLRFYEDLTVAGIAEALSLSEGAVKRYLSDGVRRMEGLLGPVTDPPEAGDAEAGTEVMDITLVTTRRTP
ncbi:sigma-70 family RNA polymerase sigma factor [Actinotalea subterranea]|uniref:sigma-70 family RNA polymerase sigma factor n=1 Tax=Actinotalea subterranea TaxID=2607497 RepID=UPI0011F048B1|nr:sigma-70 family RNA polymerase sigma factor [Actinotalea subterranea]